MLGVREVAVLSADLHRSPGADGKGVLSAAAGKHSHACSYVNSNQSLNGNADDAESK